MRCALQFVSNYQYGSPVDLIRRISPAGTTGAWQTLRRLCGSTLRPGVGIRRRSSSVSMRTSTSTPGKALLSSGFGESTRAYAWAIQDGVIGCSTTAGHWWVWQTSAWSHGEREPRAVLSQAVVNTPSNPGPRRGGIHVDVDDVLAADFGQWDLDRSRT